MQAAAFTPTDSATWSGSVRDLRHVVFRDGTDADAAAIRSVIEEAGQQREVLWMLGGIPSRWPHRDGDTAGTADTAQTPSLIAETRIDGRDVAVGIARFRIVADRRRCECCLLVKPDWRRQGLEEMLMALLIAKARSAGLRRLVAFADAEDDAVNRLSHGLGMRTHRLGSRPDDLLHTLDLCDRTQPRRRTC